MLSFIQSKFVRNIATVSFGQLLAMAIPLIATPVLSRLYSPMEYGELGAYMSIASIFGAIGNWQFAQAVIIEPKENKAQIIGQICFLACLFTSAISAIACLAFLATQYMLEVEKIRFWYLALPLSTFAGGYANYQSALATRLGQYKSMAFVQSTATLVSVVSSIALGVVGAGTVGLFLGYFIIQFGPALSYGFLLPKDWRNHKASRKRLTCLFEKYRGFAIYSTPTAFISNFTMNVPVYVMGACGLTATIGLYSRANQLLNIPISLIGGSVSQVFQREAAIEFAESKSCIRVFTKTFLSLMLIGGGPALLLAISAPAIFNFVLGEKWAEAGQIARVLAPSLLLRVMCNPLSTVFYVVGRQREDLVLMIATSIVTISLVLLSGMFCENGIWIIGAYSFGLTLTYGVFLAASYFLAKGKCKCQR